MTRINRNNYEIFFIDYIEGNLDANTKREVEVFVAENPDLMEELNMVTSYSPENMEEVKYPRKEILKIPEINFKTPIDSNNCLSYFIAYHENDLNKQQRKMTEQFLMEFPHLKKDFDTFNKLHLQSEKGIKYNSKEKLYISNYKKLDNRKIIYFISSVAAIFLGLLIIKSLLFEFPQVNNVSEVMDSDTVKENITVINEKEKIFENSQNTIQSNIGKEKNESVLQALKNGSGNINQITKTTLPERKYEKIEKMALLSNIKIESKPLDYGLLLDKKETEALAVKIIQDNDPRKNDFISREKNNIRVFLDENNDKKLNHWDLLTLATKTINTVARDSLFTLDFTDDGRFAKFALGNDLIRISKFEKN